MKHKKKNRIRFQTAPYIVFSISGFSCILWFNKMLMRFQKFFFEGKTTDGAVAPGTRIRLGQACTNGSREPDAE
jgi:hypothetical protein